MTTRYYVYRNNVIIAYVNAHTYDYACSHFASDVDVVDSRNRKCNVAFERTHNANVFRRVGCIDVRVQTEKEINNKHNKIKGYDVRTNTFN